MHKIELHGWINKYPTGARKTQHTVFRNYLNWKIKKISGILQLKNKQIS